jgi:hypothetical protein
LIDQYDALHPASALPRIRLHDLRHVRATTLLLAGEPVHVVAARLGHADPSVTLRVYAHVIQGLIPAVADTFARAVLAASEAEMNAEMNDGVSKGVSKGASKSGRKGQ